ncbi:hypothetical protein HF521_016869 [Silurus meridionalis]|uniref:RING-type domain-containing protein n=1 Tax=Silurus meridionalis TaxID=175797 RepID=A0A8T0BKL5_SILME|nr:hypothetical protein HF521_016869 [Silurus meridionalis]
MEVSEAQVFCNDDLPELECAVCFSQFNNVFNTPKVLQCGHTFCLECLARINIKSSQPDSLQCPLCRAYTPVPTLGLPKLATDIVPHGAHSAFYSTMHNTLHHHHVLHHGGVHPVPTLGLPKLATDIVVLSCLPEAMQRVYSIHFNRNRGKLQLKGIPALSHLPEPSAPQPGPREQVNTELEQDPPSGVCPASS